jgi:hypothetical protein
MAVTAQQIFDFLLANPNISDAELAAVMDAYGVSPQQVAQATGTSEAAAQQRYEAVTAPPPEPVYEPVYQPTVIPTARGNVIEGDNIEQQIAGIPQVVYETRVDPNNTANWETYNPNTGEVIDRGTFAGGGDKGLLAAAAPVIALAGSTVGLPFISSLIGGATGLTGAELAAATGATIGGGSQLVTGNSTEDALKAAILGGAGGYLSNQLSGTTNLANANFQELNAASDLASNMADQGMSLGQINQTLQSVGYQPEIITSALEDAANIISTQSTVSQASTPINQVTPVSDTVTITGNTPVNLSNVISTIGSTIPDNNTVEIVDKTEKTQPIIDTSALNQDAGTVEVVGNNTMDLGSVINLINSGNLDTTNLVNNVADTTTTEKSNNLTATDAIRLASIGTTLAGLNAATQNADIGTQFPIIPVPEEWTGQPPTIVAPRPKLQPIDFGSRNLLMGTQWEKFLSPTYGQVPAPVQYSQPTNMSYNDLMSILGSKQGMPPASSLSINDIISGIQNQYGQTPTRTMG